jgi:hypothetical protein
MTRISAAPSACHGRRFHSSRKDLTAPPEAPSAVAYGSVAHETSAPGNPCRSDRPPRHARTARLSARGWKRARSAEIAARYPGAASGDLASALARCAVSRRDCACSGPSAMSAPPNARRILAPRPGNDHSGLAGNNRDRRERPNSRRAGKAAPKDRAANRNGASDDAGGDSGSAAQAAQAAARTCCFAHRRERPRPEQRQTRRTALPPPQGLVLISFCLLSPLLGSYHTPYVAASVAPRGVSSAPFRHDAHSTDDRNRHAARQARARIRHNPPLHA